VILKTQNTSLDLIGAQLRAALGDVVTAPLPQTLQCLVEALSRAMKTEDEGTAAPIECCRSSTNTSRPEE
jgi:hypothetical protein